MHNRSLFFTAAALASACVTSAFVGCSSSSSSNPNNPGDGGTNEASPTPDSGGDEITMTTEAGSDSGTPENDSSAASETGMSGCMTKVPPSGTPLVATSTATVQGVTSDGQVVYLDSAAKKLSAVPVAGGSPALIGPWDNSLGAIYTSAAGGAVVYWNGASQKAAPYFGTLTVWTAASGARNVAAAKSYLSGLGQGYVDISPDGTRILYTDNATTTSVDIWVSGVDGTNPHKLVTGASNGASCSPNVKFVGTSAVVAYCLGQPDAAGSLNATLAAYDGTTGALEQTFTTVGFTGFSGNKAGTQIAYVTAAGQLVETIGGVAPVPVLVDAAGAGAAVFTSDGLTLIYEEGSADIYRAAIASPATTRERIATGPFGGVLALSPDDSVVLAFKTQDNTTGFTDLYILPTQPSDAGGTTLTLSSTTTAALFGPAFTADGKQVLFFKSITMSGGGYIGEYDHLALPLMNIGSKIAGNTWEEWTTTGSKTIYNDNYAAGPTGSAGYADVEALDLGASGAPAPVTLVSGADANIFVSPDKTKVIYSWSSCTDGKAGIYTVAAP